MSEVEITRSKAMVSTSCRDCVFADFEGNEQTDCSLGRLDKFEKNGGNVVGLDDDEKKYFLIEGRFCNYCRVEEALEGVPARKWVEHVVEQNKVRCEMVVYAGPGSADNQVRKSVSSILNQTLKPFRLKLLLHQSNVDATAIVPDFRDLDIPWDIATIVEENVDYNRVIDLNLAKCDATYFSICNAGYEYPVDYLEKIDQAINFDMLRFVALLPDVDGNGLFVQSKVNKALGGNKTLSVGEGEDVVLYSGIIAKLHYVAGNENAAHMVKRYGELCE